MDSQLQDSKFYPGSTKTSSETVVWEDGNDTHYYDVDSPFYTGRQKIPQADGRVDRFNKMRWISNKEHKLYTSILTKDSRRATIMYKQGSLRILFYQ